MNTTLEPDNSFVIEPNGVINIKPRTPFLVQWRTDKTSMMIVYVVKSWLDGTRSSTRDAIIQLLYKKSVILSYVTSFSECADCAATADCADITSELNVLHTCIYQVYQAQFKFENWYYSYRYYLPLRDAVIVRLTKRECEQLTSMSEDFIKCRIETNVLLSNATQNKLRILINDKAPVFIRTSTTSGRRVAGITPHPNLTSAMMILGKIFTSNDECVIVSKWTTNDPRFMFKCLIRGGQLRVVYPVISHIKFTYTRDECAGVIKSVVDLISKCWINGHPLMADVLMSVTINLIVINDILEYQLTVTDLSNPFESTAWFNSTGIRFMY